jgi:YD repeat-containing protein
MASRLLGTIAAACAALLLGVAPVLAQSSATYTYDALGRVLTSSTAAGVTIYTYDNADNRTHVTSCVGGVSGSCNHNPTANPDSATVAFGGTVVIPVLSNDSDPDAGNVLTVSGVTAASHGTSSVTSGAGSVTYIAGAGYSGADSFTYTISDGHTGVATSTVSITVNPALPIANPVSKTVAYNSSNNAVTLNITGGTPTSVSVASNPTKGTATANGLSITYTPTTGQSGSDSFTYKASNAGGTSAAATVSITISAAPPLPPTVSGGSATVAYNSSNNAMPVSLGGGPASSVAVVSGPSHGSATPSGLGINYTPANGYYGSDSFTYNATGAGGTSGTALISITIPRPPAPTVSGGSMSVAFNSSNNPAPVSITGIATSLGLIVLPTKGTATISGLNITYTPATGQSGADSFYYNAAGPGGTSGSAQISVTIAAGAGLAAPVNTTSYTGIRDLNGWHNGTLVTVTPTGGSGGYTYNWHRVSGDTSIIVSSSNSPSAYWTRAGNLINFDQTTVWVCTVTDSAGHTADTPQINIEVIEDTGQ